jgi:hypothetical protein
LKSFSNSKELLRARTPAALLPFYTTAFALASNAAHSSLIFSTNVTIISSIKIVSIIDFDFYTSFYNGNTVQI